MLVGRVGAVFGKQFSVLVQQLHGTHAPDRTFGLPTWELRKLEGELNWFPGEDQMGSPNWWS